MNVIIVFYMTRQFKMGLKQIIKERQRLIYNLYTRFFISKLKNLLIMNYYIW